MASRRDPRDARQVAIRRRLRAAATEQQQPADRLPMSAPCTPFVAPVDTADEWLPGDGGEDARATAPFDSWLRQLVAAGAAGCAAIGRAEYDGGARAGPSAGQWDAETQLADEESTLEASSGRRRAAPFTSPNLFDPRSERPFRARKLRGRRPLDPGGGARSRRRGAAVRRFQLERELETCPRTACPTPMPSLIPTVAGPVACVPSCGCREPPSPEESVTPAGQGEPVPGGPTSRRALATTRR